MSSKTFLIVTITCPDRPGIVERITQSVVRYGGNWEDSRLARLGGDFAGIVMVSVPAAQAVSLEQALLQLADEHTTVTIKTSRADAPEAGASHALYQVHLTGADHEGIVHRVSAYLASRGINVESMETHLTRAPMSAAPLFHMTAKIKVPAEVTRDELDQSLSQIGDALGVDIELRGGDDQ
jgi:glycine cleavage system regulatory protein